MKAFLVFYLATSTIEFNFNFHIAKAKNRVIIDSSGYKNGEHMQKATWKSKW